MKKGDVVMIYEDPVTRKKPEGEAKLVTFLGNRGRMQDWMVRFGEESHTYERQIYTETKGE